MTVEVSPASFPLIGIRDSGVGGLTVARCIRQLLPDAPQLYFADTAHVPYGDRTPQEVRHFALNISQFLIEQGAQIIVFACNTTSAHALGAAREKFSVPVFGMIEPGAKAALQIAQGEDIGVLATQSTVDSGVYPATIEKLHSGTRCWQIACPEFVPLVENEQSESIAARRACRYSLKPLREAGVRTVILGCTHYPLLLPILQDEAPEITFVDPAEAVAHEVACLFKGVGSSSAPQDVYFVSGLREGVRDWIEKLMKNPVPDIRRGPVFDLPLTSEHQNYETR